jgi:hypothetical protein
MNISASRKNTSRVSICGGINQAIRGNYSFRGYFLPTIRTERHKMNISASRKNTSRVSTIGGINQAIRGNYRKIIWFVIIVLVVLKNPKRDRT